MGIYNDLLEFGVLTGSRAFGTAKGDSDWDIVYPIYADEKIKKIIEGFEITPSDYFNGYKIQVGERVINLIPVHPQEFIPWVLATRAMAATLETSGLTDKYKIHAVFQGIVQLYKGTMISLSDLRSYNDPIWKLIGKGNS